MEEPRPLNTRSLQHRMSIKTERNGESWSNVSGHKIRVMFNSVSFFVWQFYPAIKCVISVAIWHSPDWEILLCYNIFNVNPHAFVGWQRRSWLQTRSGGCIKSRHRCWTKRICTGKLLMKCRYTHKHRADTYAEHT